MHRGWVCVAIDSSSDQASLLGCAARMGCVARQLTAGSIVHFVGTAATAVCAVNSGGCESACDRPLARHVSLMASASGQKRE